MTEIDFDWTDHGTAEDHADQLNKLYVQAVKAGRYGDAASLHVAANCIRYLGAKVEVLEKENDAAEAEIEALRDAASRYLNHSDSGEYRDSSGLRPGASMAGEDLRALADHDQGGE